MPAGHSRAAQVREDDGTVRWFGSQPAWGETLEDARVRFLSRFEGTCIRAAEREQNVRGTDSEEG